MSGENESSIITIIHELQHAIHDDYLLSSFQDLLSPKRMVSHSIPFVIFTPSGKVFKAFGNIGQNGKEECFHTPFFRVENIIEGCATLSLLQPFKGNRPVEFEEMTDMQEVTRLVKTNSCVEIDLSFLKNIHCVNPRLVQYIH